MDKVKISGIFHKADWTLCPVCPSYVREICFYGVDLPPCTRNGFTGAINGQIIPEYISYNLISVLDGAQLIEIELDGTEKLRAIYSDNAEKFIPVE